MKNISWFVFACCTILVSCSKEESQPATDGMVRTVDSVTMDGLFGLMPLDDGTYLILSQGKLIKIDGAGKKIWKKSVLELSSIRAAIELPGTGYVLFGLPANPQSSTSLSACRYTVDGNFIDEHVVNANGPANYTVAPAFIIRLQNGGYAIATSSSFSNSGYLRILDVDFNLLYSRAITSPPGYSVLNIQSFCELNGGDFAISASVSGSASINLSWIHPAVIRTGPTGITRSIWVTGDSVHSAVPTVVAPYQGGCFAVSSGMGSWGADQGAFVNYYGPDCIAGRIRLDRFGSTGQLEGGREFTGYPGFGLVKSIHTVEADGGYVLCGTVNNNSSSISVSKTKIYVCKLDAGLNEQWSRVIETNYQAIGIDARPTSDGGFMVAGNLKSFNASYQMLMIKMDANGNY